MQRSVVLVCALVGCGRLDFAAQTALGGDASGASGSGLDSGSAGSDCWALWGAQPPALTTPQLVDFGSDFGSSEQSEGDPFLADGGLTLYATFGTAQQTLNFYATRATLADPFSDPKFTFSTNQGDSFTKVSVAGDDRHGVVAALLQGTSHYELYAATGSDGSPGFATLALGPMAALNAGTVEVFDPELSLDGLTLRYAPSFVDPQQNIYEAHRATEGDAFGAGSAIAFANGPLYTADPSVSPDQLTMLASSFGSDQRPHVGYASRPDLTSDWTWTGDYPGLRSGSALDGDPVRTPDGCTLWFSSTRAGDGLRHLYTADVVR